MDPVAAPAYYDFSAPAQCARPMGRPKGRSCIAIAAAPSSIGEDLRFRSTEIRYNLRVESWRNDNRTRGRSSLDSAQDFAARRHQDGPFGAMHGGGPTN
jgi:hypothetical protein